MQAINRIQAVLMITLFTAMGSMAAAADTTDLDRPRQPRHSMHDALENHFAHESIVILPRTYTMSEEDEQHLRAAMASYLRIVDELSENDGTAANEAAREMANNVTGVTKKRMDEVTAETWEHHAELIQVTLAQFQQADDLGEKRSFFSHLSEIAYCMTKSFRIEDATLRALYCPIAFSGKGAFWIDDANEVRNPYFSHPVTECVQETEYMGARKQSYISPFGRRVHGN
jgi:hypothetical protein